MNGPFEEGPGLLADLSIPVRMFVLGDCRGDVPRASAVTEVVFLRLPTRDVAARYRVSRRGLQRSAARVRAGLQAAVRRRVIQAADLAAIDR